MTQLTPDATLDVLGQLHGRLESHFRELHERRATLSGEAPVFALEHGLLATDLDALKASVRRAVEQGFSSKYWRQSWLPFVVYAAESGYDYVGNEFWPTFEESTPGWDIYGNRDRIRMWFRHFTIAFGGAIPKGAFARSFPIIAWPITHAVLPVYLQRHLAQLLYEFRTGLTTDLLQQPEELGTHLAARAWDYTERFRIFCENTSLLGQVAVALLSGEGEESPYLLQSTLLRLVEGLEEESQAKFWLQGARRAASEVRARGFQPGASRGGAGTPPHDRMPNPTDPRLVLRAGEQGWRVFAQLPDLGSLSRRLPHIYDELRTLRAHVSGAEQAVIARGRLTTSGQEVRLTRWPDPDEPFVQLEGGDAAVNRLLRDQMEITRGPIWVFKRRDRGSAVEVKGRLVHPGGIYYVVHDGSWSAPDVPWVEEARLDVSNAEAVRVAVPDRLDEDESGMLVEAGLTVISDVVIRPVGVAASAWDGEGAVEWIAGEPGLVGIRVEQIPSSYTLSLAGKLRTHSWPEGEPELFLRLEDLPIGEHELRVTLNGGEQQTLTEGSLAVTIRDPQVRADAAEVGEGIRLLASPARPTMNHLWEPDALSIVGPHGLRVELVATLRSDDNRELAKAQQQIVLPLLEADWVGVAKKIRGDDRFTRGFDQAESIELTVSRAGVGYATLSADRGFQPLRWQLFRARDGNRAHLIDRTDSATTRVEMYRVESPLVAVACEAETDIIAPATGGLLRATVGEGIDATATVLLPTQPNDLLGIRVTPEVRTGSRTPGELATLASAHERWAEADLPGDVFAQYQRDEVLEAITRALVSLVAGGRWAAIERGLANASDPLDFIDKMQETLGETDEQKRLARTIGRNLHAWLDDPASLLTGFAEVLQSTVKASGFSGHDSAPRFLLLLAGRPGRIMQWPVVERGFLLQEVVNTPLLLRAARFAVLGTRFLSEADKTPRGF